MAKKKITENSGSEISATSVIENDNYKPFLEVQEVRDVDRSIFTIYNPNPKYEYYWALKSKMRGNRYGEIWVAVDKTHPDFEGMSVECDDTPDMSFFSTREHILVCTRKETFEKAKMMKADETKLRADAFESRRQYMLDRMTTEGVKLSNKTNSELEEFYNDYQ